MVVGVLGSVVFQTSDDYVKTFSELSMKTSVKYAEHTRVGTNSLLEYVGVDPAEIDLKIHLSVYLGVNVSAEFTRLHHYERDGAVLSLILGENMRIANSFVIQSSELEEQTWDGNGNLTSADMTLHLLEYVAG